MKIPLELAVGNEAGRVEIDADRMVETAFNDLSGMPDAVVVKPIDDGAGERWIHGDQRQRGIKRVLCPDLSRGRVAAPVGAREFAGRSHGEALQGLQQLALVELRQPWVGRCPHAAEQAAVIVPCFPEPFEFAALIDPLHRSAARHVEHERNRKVRAAFQREGDSIFIGIAGGLTGSLIFGCRPASTIRKAGFKFIRFFPCPRSVGAFAEERRHFDRSAQRFRAGVFDPKMIDQSLRPLRAIGRYRRKRQNPRDKPPVRFPYLRHRKNVVEKCDPVVPAKLGVEGVGFRFSIPVNLDGERIRPVAAQILRRPNAVEPAGVGAVPVGIAVDRQRLEFAHLPHVPENPVVRDVEREIVHVLGLGKDAFGVAKNICAGLPFQPEHLPCRDRRDVIQLG